MRTAQPTPLERWLDVNVCAFAVVEGRWTAEADGRHIRLHTTGDFHPAKYYDVVAADRLILLGGDKQRAVSGLDYSLQREPARNAAYSFRGHIVFGAGVEKDDRESE